MTIFYSIYKSTEIVCDRMAEKYLLIAAAYRKINSQNMNIKKKKNSKSRE